MRLSCICVGGGPGDGDKGTTDTLRIDNVNVNILEEKVCCNTQTADRRKDSLNILLRKLEIGRVEDDEEEENRGNDGWREIRGKCAGQDEGDPEEI